MYEFRFKFFSDIYLKFFLYAIIFFYLFSSFLVKFFTFYFDVNIIKPTLSILKLFFIFYFLLSLILNLNKKKIIFVYFALLSGVYFVGNYKQDFSFLGNENFLIYLKYLFPFIVIGVVSLLQNKAEFIPKCFNIFEKVLIFNSVLVFFGFLFSIDFFYSYLRSSRFGYSGFLESRFYEYLLIIVISRRVFSLKKIDVVLCVLLLSGFFIGTKNFLFYFVLLILYYLYYYKYKKFLIIYSFFIAMIFIFLRPFINFFVLVFPFWQPILHKYGYLGLITSTRSLSVKNSTEYLKINGTFKNLFFGGVDFSKFSVEMDLIDLFLFFGIIGAAIYLVLLSEIVNKSYHLVPLITAFFSGDLLLSTFIIFIYFLWMYESHKEVKGLF